MNVLSIRLAPALLFLVLLLPSLRGQGASGSGAVRLVNAVSMPGTAHFYVNGGAFTERGFVPGEYGGSVGYGTGPVEIKVKHDTLGEATLTLDLKAGDKVAVIAGLAPLDKTAKPTPDGKPPKRKLALTTLYADPATKNRAVSLSQFTDHPEIQVTVRDQTVALEPTKPKLVEVEGKSHAIEIKVGAAPLTFFREEHPEIRAVVLFEKEDGTLGFVQFSHSK